MAGLAAVLAVAAVALWIGWAEDHPRAERALRVLVHDQLDDWFPDEMSPDDGWYGLHPRAVGAGASGSAPGRLPRVLLLHGLDEPGSIWDDLVPALAGAGFEVWEFRYPNDQGIDRSAALLAQRWAQLPAGAPFALVGHSMGGLVAREFVSLWRHPAIGPARVAGPAVAGALLVGTPNQGSEWARLRVWLELRDQFPTGQGRRFSLFAALRDGTGEAKIDLRPGSDFLEALNVRPWPPEVPVFAIAGRLLAPPAGMAVGCDDASAEAGSRELGRHLRRWWSGIGDGLGDGVVRLDSVRVPGGPPPLVLDASHRGLLVGMLPGAAQPPAIAPIIDTLRTWGAGSSAPGPNHASEPVTHPP